MNFEIFELERIQSLYENTVQYNLTESGIHPYTPKELLSEAEIETMLNRISPLPGAIFRQMTKS